MTMKHYLLNDSETVRVTKNCTISIMQVCLFVCVCVCVWLSCHLWYSQMYSSCKIAQCGSCVVSSAD